MRFLVHVSCRDHYRQKARQTNIMILASSLQSWNRNTNRDNMQEKPLVYVRLNLQVEYYWKPINKLKLCLIFLNSAKSKNLQNLDWSIQKNFHQAGLFVWRHPTLGLQLGLVGRDLFLFWWRSVSLPGPYCFFDRNLVAGKRTFIRDYRYNR